MKSLDPQRRVAILEDASELPYDLFLGIPKHRVPEVVAASGMSVEGWIPVDRKTRLMRYLAAHAVGDVTSVGAPSRGVRRGAARVVAADPIAQVPAANRPCPTPERIPVTSSLVRSRSGRGCGVFSGLGAHTAGLRTLGRPGGREGRILVRAAGRAGLVCRRTRLLRVLID